MPSAIVHERGQTAVSTTTSSGKRSSLSILSYFGIAGNIDYSNAKVSNRSKIAIIPSNIHNQSTKPTKVPLHLKLIVAAAAGITGTTVIFPIDMVKTRLMSAGNGSPLRVAMDMFSKEGISGFYRGLGANLVGVTPEKAIKLAANDVLREHLTLCDGRLPLEREIIAGAGAGVFQVIATNPMELIKIRMQMQSLLPIHERQSTLQVLRSFSIPGLYQGTIATLCRDVPFSIIFFPLYANLKKMTANTITGENSFFSILSSGMLAGAIGASGVTPADVIKTRLQVAGGKEKYGTLLNCFNTILREEGIRAFYKGVVPRTCVVAPLFGISLLSFEVQKEYIMKNGLPDFFE